MCVRGKIFPLLSVLNSGNRPLVGTHPELKQPPPNCEGFMNDATHYDVFLSHNSSDKPDVERLAKRLIDEAKLRPFLDKWHLIPGVAWQSELEHSLRLSKTVAVFIGPSGTSWPHEEMQVETDDHALAIQ
jgi:hypothetical protein